MKNVRIYSYNPHSEGAKALSQALGVKRIKHEGSTWRPRRDSRIINWGSSSIPPHDWQQLTFINHPEAVAYASNKLEFFKKMPEEIIPEWTSDASIATQWLIEGHTVVARRKLNGHSGEGIVLISELPEGEDLPIVSAPLYTKYFKKKHEYRIHIAFGDVIDVQQKKRKSDVPDEEVNWKVRNLQGGFIYAREGVEPPECVLDVARKSFEASGLDFGAFDVIYNEQEDRAVVLECNTAPGLSGQTVNNYANAFRKVLT